jgi:hypothetical protein
MIMTRKHKLPLSQSRRKAKTSGTEAAQNTTASAPRLSDVRGQLEAIVLTCADARLIVQQAQRLLEQLYANLVQKRASFAFDPIQRLRVLETTIPQSGSLWGEKAINFHREMLAIFAALRDLHTVYVLPAPFRNAYAYLPFLIESYLDADTGTLQYAVTKVYAPNAGTDMQPGVLVRYWNGTPIQAHLDELAMQQAGGNPAARQAQALYELTTRSFYRALPPRDEWVLLTCFDPAGNRTFEVRQPWLFWVDDPSLNFDPEAGRALPRRGARAFASAEMDKRLHERAVDTRSLRIVDLRRRLYARTRGNTKRKSETGNREIETAVDHSIRARVITRGTHEYGYLRIFTFNVPTWLDEFVGEIARLLEVMPRRGLIIDVRGNPGGFLAASEGLLQLLTPKTIAPELGQFPCSPATLSLSRANGKWLGFYRESIEQSVHTGAVHSQGKALTPVEFANFWGQHYYGPVVVITDGLCYSATDIFAAGVNDHEIGPVVGVGDNTGAGGANVWNYAEASALLRDGGLRDAFPPLPADVEMSVGVRRMLRVGAKAGIPLEDIGITVNVRHNMTLNDILNNNEDLLSTAVSEIEKQHVANPKRPELTVVRPDPVQTNNRTLNVSGTNMTHIEIIVDEEIPQRFTLTGTAKTVTITVPDAEALIKISGYQKSELVATWRDRV